MLLVDLAQPPHVEGAGINLFMPHSRSGRAHALETLSLIAAHNRCASGVRAALPSYPFPRLTLTSGMSQFGPASGSHRDSGAGYVPAIAAIRLLRSIRFTCT